MDARARTASAGYSVHSSKAMMMSAPSPISRLHCALRAEKVRRTVKVRAECDALLVDFAKSVQAEYLESARVGEDRALPRHKAVQSTQPAYDVYTGPQVEVVGISEQNLDVQLVEQVLGHAFDRGQRSNRHKDEACRFLREESGVCRRGLVQQWLRCGIQWTLGRF